jgi:hypothetical protein
MQAAAFAARPRRIVIGAFALGADALLQHRADDAPILCRPEIGAGVEQMLARHGKPGRSTFVLAECQPLQPVPHAGGRGPLVQFAVDRLHLCFCRTQQALHFGRNLGLQVVFEQFAFARAPSGARGAGRCRRRGAAVS